MISALHSVGFHFCFFRCHSPHRCDSVECARSNCWLVRSACSTPHTAAALLLPPVGPRRTAVTRRTALTAMSRRPNRGGGEQARAAKAAAERAKAGGGGGGRGGRRGGRGGGGGSGADDDSAPRWLAATSSATGERFVPVSLSSASGVYVNGGPIMASATASSSATFAPLSDTALAALAAAPAPANVYRSSVHGVPQPVEVSEEQLASLRHAITATRVHDLTVQSQLMAGAVGGGSGAGAVPLFGAADPAVQPLFSDGANDSDAAVASPAPSAESTVQLAATASPPGSLPWLQLQVGQTLSHYQFRRRLVKSVQRHVLTPANLASAFASNRELMAQLQNFRLEATAATAAATAASSPQELVGLIQRATQACIDWLLVHAPESDLPASFALHAQPLQVVRLHDDDALALHSAAEDKIRAILDLGLGFRRVDVVDAFRQVAGDLPELGAPAVAASSARAKVPLEALDENLVLWILYDWFDLRTASPPATALAGATELDESERDELRENERIVIESMFPESAPGRTEGSLRIPLVRSPLIPEGGALEIAHPRGNLYPSEPPLLVFTHPHLSSEAKRFVVTQLYEKAWSLQNEMMAYELHTWLTAELHAMLLPHFPVEMAALGSEVAAVAAEAARREKEGSKEFQAKKARLAKKEAERAEAAEKAERERAKVDREFAAKRAKEAAAAQAVVSKRIGGLVNVIGKLRAVSGLFFFLCFLLSFFRTHNWALIGGGWSSIAELQMRIAVGGASGAECGVVRRRNWLSFTSLPPVSSNASPCTNLIACLLYLIVCLFLLWQEEEEEEERRAMRIQQLKAIMEAEEAAMSPQPPSAATDAADAAAAAAAAAAGAAASTDSDGALESSLVSSFPQNGPLGPEETSADDTLLDTDALEIQDSGLEAPGELFAPPAGSASSSSAAATVSAANQRLNASLLAEWRRTQQSAKYKTIMAKRCTLPAQLMREDVMRMILSRQVVVISGSTGCGKSTQVPQFILDQCIEAGAGSGCSIICTQPRRLAAIAVAERVAAERAERIGDTVGYSIRLESKRSSRTRLLFCTTGIVLRHLESSPTLAGVSHVIVDEVHERGLDSDFLLIILKGLLAKRPDLKLILMSATLNAEIFTKVRCCCCCAPSSDPHLRTLDLYFDLVKSRARGNAYARALSVCVRMTSWLGRASVDSLGLPRVFCFVCSSFFSFLPRAVRLRPAVLRRVRVHRHPWARLPRAVAVPGGHRGGDGLRDRRPIRVRAQGQEERRWWRRRRRRRQQRPGCHQGAERQARRRRRRRRRGLGEAGRVLPGRVLRPRPALPLPRRPRHGRGGALRAGDAGDPAADGHEQSELRADRGAHTTRAGPEYPRRWQHSGVHERHGGDQHAGEGAPARPVAERRARGQHLPAALAAEQRRAAARLRDHAAGLRTHQDRRLDQHRRDVAHHRGRDRRHRLGQDEGDAV